MEYQIRLEQFEGPLDLLLHLIKKEDINIFDISIEKIAQQYLEYIEVMKNDNLDIASEYLVMASNLMEMKSRMLLPNKTEKENEELEEEKYNLVEKLVEYEKYKKVTNTFKKLEAIRNKIYTRDSEEILNYKNNDNIDYGIDLNDLVNALNNFLLKKELDKPLNTKIEKKEYSINKRCYEIKNIINKKRHVNFEDLFDIVTREYIIVTFLAILSLVKSSEITIKQESNFNNIIINIKE